MTFGGDVGIAHWAPRMLNLHCAAYKAVEQKPVMRIPTEPEYLFVYSTDPGTSRASSFDLPYGEGRHAPSRMDAGRPADQRAPS